MHERVWRCDCGGGHFMHVTTDIFPDIPNTGYFGIETYDNAYYSLWQRVKMAWRILRKPGHEHIWAEVLLTPEIAREIAAELEQAALVIEARQTK